jgi:methionyl-tRNA synthetase
MTEKLLITSALPYINGIKHLGNLAGSLLPADVLARFHRARGRDVLFVCGTDEHGTPAELAALEAGQEVAVYCAEQHAVQADIYRRFGLSFDHFSRTSGAANHELSREIFRALDARGFVEARPVRQVWCETDGRFLPDRYVVGTCPRCGYLTARGDQCDGCGRLLDPADLLSPRSAVSGATDLEVREVRHLFLRQSALADELRAWVEGDGDWEPLARSIALKWLDEGLEDRCVTRDLSWGIDVPRPGYEDLKLYVWFDAPIGYLAAVKEWADARGEDWRDRVRAGQGRQWIQVLGKDNVPFHAITFPATLIGSGVDVRLADRIKGLNWLTYEGGKFSTSQRRGVFTDVALDLFPADTWRWWLTANAPEGADVDFTFARFADDVNSDLADNLGNLVNRILRFAAARFGGCVPDGGEPEEPERELAVTASALLTRCADDLEDCRLRKFCNGLRALWSLGNAYVANQAPWTLATTDPVRAACVTRTALAFVAVVARASAPVIPSTAATILGALGEDERTDWPADAAWILEGRQGVVIAPPPPLFAKIDSNRVAELSEAYSGARSAGS